MHDILPEETWKWQFVEKILTDTAELYGYKEIRVPVMEEQSLFERSIGSATDIVAKEIYAFQDRKGRRLALRPEGTASVVRAFIDSEMPSARKVTRLYYYGQMFRYDRPQKDRYRQFNQFGVELLGGKDPFFDGEVIEMLNAMMKRLNLPDSYLGINTLGCQQCKTRYTEVIRDWMTERQDKLCSDCQARLKTAPLRILDCKNVQCRETAKDAPRINDILCEECKKHFAQIEEYLKNTDIPYKVQPNLVRGLDYYTRTVFELYVQGEENAVAAGGRYDSLVGDLGGPDIPAVGFAIGMERIISLLGKQVETPPVFIHFICIGKEAKLKGVEIAGALRKIGITTEIDYEERGLSAQMKEADRSGAQWCIILGEQELEKREIIIKDMVTGKQENISLNNYLDRVKEIITGKL